MVEALQEKTIFKMECSPEELEGILAHLRLSEKDAKLIATRQLYHLNIPEQEMRYAESKLQRLLVPYQIDDKQHGVRSSGFGHKAAIIGSIYDKKA